MRSGELNKLAARCAKSDMHGRDPSEKALQCAFDVEKTVDVEGMSADKFGSELTTLLKG